MEGIQKTTDVVKNNLGVYVVPEEIGKLLEQMRNGTLNTLMSKMATLSPEIKELEESGSEMVVTQLLNLVQLINEDLKTETYNPEIYREFFKEYIAISSLDYTEFGLTQMEKDNDFRVGGALHKIYEFLKGKFLEEEIKYSIVVSDYSKSEMVSSYIFQWIKLFGIHGNIEKTFPGIFMYWENSGLLEKKGQLQDLLDEANIQREVYSESK